MDVTKLKSRMGPYLYSLVKLIYQAILDCEISLFQ